MSDFQPKKGDFVEITPDNLQGTIRFIGSMNKRKGTWYGIELTSPNGDTDGMVDGRYYEGFTCKDKYGIFVTRKRIKRIITKKKIKKDISGYIHKTIELECLIESNTLTKKTKYKIKLPSTDDWHKNLQSVLARVPKKFPIISKMNKKDWSLMLKNGAVIDVKDAEKFGEVLSEIEPPATVYLVNNTNSRDKFASRNRLIVEYKGQSIAWIPPNGESEEEKVWEQNYSKFINDIHEKYKLNDIEYELKDNDECEIVCGVDLMSVWHSLKNDNQLSVAKILIIKVDESDVNDVADDLLHYMSDTEINELKQSSTGKLEKLGNDETLMTMLEEFVDVALQKVNVTNIVKQNCIQFSQEISTEFQDAECMDIAKKAIETAFGMSVRVFVKEYVWGEINEQCKDIINRYRCSEVQSKNIIYRKTNERLNKIVDELLTQMTV